MCARGNSIKKNCIYCEKAVTAKEIGRECKEEDEEEKRAMGLVE